MLRDLKIATKLTIAFSSFVALTLVIWLVARQGLVVSSGYVDDVGKNRMPSMHAAQDMIVGQLHVAGGVRALINRRLMEPAVRQANYDEIASGFTAVAEGKRKYEALPITPEEARIWPNVVSKWDEYRQMVQSVVDSQHEKDAVVASGAKLDDPRVTQLDEKSLAIVNRARELRRESLRMLEELVRINNDGAAGAVAQASSSAAKTVSFLSAVSLIGMLIAVALGVGLARNISHVLKTLREETTRLSESAVSGQLSTRADVMAVPSEFRSIVQGINETLDAVVTPLGVAAGYLEKISQGNIPPKITDSYHGDFNTIKNNLNEMIETLNALIGDMNHMSQQHDAGEIDVWMPDDKFQGAFRTMAKGVNTMAGGHIVVMKKAMASLGEFAAGNFDAPLERFPGKKVFINESVELLRKNSKALIEDADQLSRAAVEGKLSTRTDASRHQGDYRKIVQGFNHTLDAVIGPLNVAADYVDKISRGNIPPKITDSYNGDFNTIKNNLNRCIDAVHALTADADALVKAAIEGKLSTRADVTKHEGDFRRIVDGVNRTLDAVITPVMDATEALEKLAHYDLRARVTADYQGDHARIKDALNGTARALQDALVQVADAVEQVAEASQQIASSSQAVSQGASEQASSLEETSSSLEEMAGMTKQNADNTIQARSLAQTTKEAAEKGGQAMTRMTDAMEKIRAASEGTAQIIKDINEIAFQTNLLALNAAVEAARAGDAGRGFAVVAEEVRNLALRSKEAAKKTEDLIKVAVGHSENGRVITNEVAGSLSEIVSAAAKVNDIVSEIAVASQEQSRGIDQVNTAVAEMDKVVQVAASNAEESSSAAEELASQSEELSSLIQRFELDREAGRRRTASSDKSAATPRRPALHSVPPPRRGTGALARTAKKANGSNGSARKPTAEELIPLESDPEFQDF